MDLTAVSGVVVALLGGAAIGVERQRTGHASGRQARLGGIRTFTLLGGVSGLAGWMFINGLTGGAVAISAGAVALIVAGYVAASRRDIDATTEVAALVVVAAGLLAGTGRLALASGAIAITTLLLVEKSRLHALVRRIDDEEMRAAARFGVMAVVILPLLPEGPVGPWGGVRPRDLWLLVLFFTGLSFIGFLARRVLGAAHGYPLAGLLAGLVSSTQATFTFARLSRQETLLSRALAVGAIGACTMLFPRVLLATLVLNPAVARALIPYLAVPFGIGVIGLVAWLSRNADSVRDMAMPTNPLQIWPALQMAVTFQVVIMGVALARRLFGDVGLLASAAVLGLTDVDALTISMARASHDSIAPALAAQAITIGILVNSVMKLGIAVTLGTAPFRRVIGVVLGAMALALAAAIAAMR